MGFQVRGLESSCWALPTGPGPSRSLVCEVDPGRSTDFLTPGPIRGLYSCAGMELVV